MLIRYKALSVIYLDFYFSIGGSPFAFLFTKGFDCVVTDPKVVLTFMGECDFFVEVIF
jgi:hypothetical protein